MIWDIYRDSKGNLWISEYDKGVFCYNPAGELIVDFSCAKTQNRTDAILDITEYEDEIWLASDGKGILSYSLSNKTLRELKYYQNSPLLPTVKSFSFFYKDNYNNLWAGSIRRGAFRVNNVYVKSFTNRLINVSGGMGEETVLSFYDDKNGDIWIGTDGNGIHLFDTKTTSFKHFPSASDKKVTSITRLNDNELLIGLYKEGLMRFNKTTGQQNQFNIVDENNQPLIWNKWIEANLLNTEDGNIYISAEKIYCYSLSTKKFKLISTGLPDDGLLQLVRSSFNPNKLLIFGQSIVSTLDLKTHKVDKLFQFPAENGIINSIDIDAQNYWIATNKGVYSRNIQNGSFHK